MSDPKAIFLTGVAGSGKSTLMQKLLKYPQITKVLSVTTREPRTGEREGHEYHFISNKKFRKLKKKGLLLEHVLIHDSFYFATRGDWIEKALAEGYYPLKNIDPIGMKIIEEDGKLKGRYVCVFLDIPDEAMEERIRENHPGLSDIEVDRKIDYAKTERAVAATIKNCIPLDTTKPQEEVFEKLKQELGFDFL